MSFTDTTESKQKAEYVAHDLSKRGRSDYIELTYKRLDGQNPGQEMKTGNFVIALDQATKDLIKGKGTFVVVKNKNDKGFWNLTRVEDMSTYTAPTSTGYTKSNTYTPKSSSSSASSSYNTAGIKVGAVLHDSVALAGKGATTAQVKKIAEELLSLSYELEANVNAGKYTSTAKTETLQSISKTVTSTTVTEDLDDGLSSIDF